MRVARLTYGGLPPRVTGRDGRRLILWGAARASSDACGKACERRAGESPFQPPVTSPGRAETQGSIQRARRPNQASRRQGFSRGSKPRNRGLSGRPVAPATEATAGKTVRGSTGSETARYLVRGVGSEGWIPRALPARKKAGADLEGVSRAEGNQTLDAEGGGQGVPAWTGPPSPVSAVGKKSPREEPVGFGRTARVRWGILRRRAKLEERICVGYLTVTGEVRRKENRTAEEMVNGKAGPPNQCRRYFDGLKLWTRS